MIKWWGDVVEKNTPRVPKKKEEEKKKGGKKTLRFSLYIFTFLLLQVVHSYS